MRWAVGRVTARNSSGRAKFAMPLPADSLPALITEISNEEVCPQCQCFLTHLEIKRNKVGQARPGCSTNCDLKAPAAVADLGAPLYSSRGIGAQTESTYSPTTVGAGASFPPGQHQALTYSIPCQHWEQIERHRFLRRMHPFIPGGIAPTCEHCGAGDFLRCEKFQPEDYEQYVLRRNSHEDPISTRQFEIDDERIMRGINKERMLLRSPTQTSWCIPGSQGICLGYYNSALFETEAVTLRGDTPVAAPVEEGYFSSETMRAREVLYSPALVRKLQPGPRRYKRDGHEHRTGNTNGRRNYPAACPTVCKTYPPSHTISRGC